MDRRPTVHRSRPPRHTRAAPIFAARGRETEGGTERLLGTAWGSAMTAPRTAAAVPSLRQVAGWSLAWLRGHPVNILTSVVVGGAFSYAWNVWLIAMLYRGSHRVPVGAPATGSRNFIYGGLFWALCGMLIFGLASYWHGVGTRRFFSELQGLPQALGGLIRRDHTARVHLLWGAALAMLLAVVLSPSLGLVLAIGLLTVAPGLIGSIVAAFLAQVWSRLMAPFSPTGRTKVGGLTGTTVGMIGSAAALVAAFLIHDTIIKLVAVAVLAALALALSRVEPPSTGALLAALGALFVLAWVANAANASADTGGSPDCPCTAGLSCMADPAALSNSLVGALAGGLGGLAGAVGGALASAAGAFGGASAASGGDVDSRVVSGDEALQALWAATHPGQPYDPNAPLYPAAGGFPPGISGGGYSTHPDGSIDPNKPVALVVDWPHPTTPPTDQWLNPPQGGFDGKDLANNLQTKFGLPAQTVTGPDGQTYVKVPENLPPNWASSAWGTKQVGGQTVIDPNSPVFISQWPTSPPPPLPPLPPPPSAPPPAPQPSPQPTQQPSPPPSAPPPAPQPSPQPTQQPSPPPSAPPPAPQPSPQPTQQPAEDPAKAARLAQLRQQVQQSQAEADSANRRGNVMGFGEGFFTVISHAADVGVNILSNLAGPQGKGISYGYSAIKDIAGGVAEGQTAGQIMTHVATDTALNAGFNKIPIAAGAKGAIVASSLGNKAASEVSSTAIDKGFEQKK
jgi:hypothetical protein